MPDERESPSAWLELLFFVGFAFLACHELDAVAQSEWRMLPLFDLLEQQTAFRVFVIGHVPLFAVLMWWTGSTRAPTRRRSQLAVDAFLVVHAVLHFVLRNHESNTFDSWVSHVCIHGAGVVGLAHGTLTWCSVPRR